MKKLCKKCKKLKSISAFGIHLQYKGGRRTYCKVCQTEYAKNYRKNNLEKVKARYAIWRQANPDKVKNACKNWQMRNIQKSKTLHKAWMRKNAAHVNAYNSKQRASRLKATPRWLTKKHFEEIEQFYIKARKLSTLYRKQYEVDHIMPLKGKNSSGLHVPWNLQILLKSVNASKGNRV